MAHFARLDDSNIVTNVIVIGNYDMDFYGLPQDHSESTLVIDEKKTKYIRDDNTAIKYATWILLNQANQHLKLKVKLPLKYMNLEIGDIIRFDKIINNIKPYGIDYANHISAFSDIVNGQGVYPYFMITSSIKTLDFCEFEVMQMHNLKTCNSDGEGLDACGECGGNTFPESWTGDNAGIDCDCQGHTWDVCGVCGGNETNVENCTACPDGYSRGCNEEGDCLPENLAPTFDCNGVCDGDTQLDECDVCGGDGASIECWDGETVVCKEEDCPPAEQNLLKELQVELNDAMFVNDDGDLTDDLTFTGGSINETEEHRIVDSGNGKIALQELIEVNQDDVTYSFNTKGIKLKFHKMQDSNGTLEVKYVSLGYCLLNSDGICSPAMQVVNNVQDNFQQSGNMLTTIFAEWDINGCENCNQDLFFEESSQSPNIETKLKYSNENTLFELLNDYNFNSEGVGDEITARLVIRYTYGYTDSDEMIITTPIAKTKYLHFTPAYCANKGDLNGDGVLNMLDIVMLSNCILEGDCAEKTLYCGDVNGDGVFNVLDLFWLAQCILSPDCD